MTELRSCPFCGGPAAYMHGGLFCNRVMCEHCGAMTGCDDLSTVTVEWNQRATDDSYVTLAVVNAWLDNARFNPNLTTEEQMACWEVLHIVKRIQKEEKE